MIPVRGWPRVSHKPAAMGVVCRNAGGLPDAEVCLPCMSCPLAPYARSRRLLDVEVYPTALSALPSPSALSSSAPCEVFHATEDQAYDEVRMVSMSVRWCREAQLPVVF